MTKKEIVIILREQDRLLQRIFQTRKELAEMAKQEGMYDEIWEMLYSDGQYTLRRDECWEELIAPNGKVICGNHKLDATEILNALDIPYVEEED